MAFLIKSYISHKGFGHGYMEMGANRGRNTTRILTVLLALAMVALARESAQFASALEKHVNNGKNQKTVTIVVDAGHGGG